VPVADAVLHEAVREQRFTAALLANNAFEVPELARSLRSPSARRLFLALVFRKLIVRPRGFTVAPSHQTIEASKISARGAAWESNPLS
jgi:hypothetical protein